MHILENVPLALYSTMRLGGRARYLATASTKDEVEELMNWAKNKSIPIIVVGGGSNIVWRDEGFEGLVVVNKIMGREVVSQDEHSITVKVGAGENWDSVVGWTVEQGLSGIETLSLIPGTAGATPVQNVEAYGEQIADTLEKVAAFDVSASEFINLNREECQLGYRTSRFKNVDHGKFVICELWLKLRRAPVKPPFHRGLQRYVDEHHITDFSPASLRQAIIAIRTAKLPDPAKVANNGSFFKNPFVSTEAFKKLQTEFPDILNYPADDDRVKLSAMWLMEHAGFGKGYTDSSTGMGLWPKHNLVLINEHAKTTDDLLAFRQKIIDTVKQKFGVTLEQEPELLP